MNERGVVWLTRESGKEWLSLSLIILKKY